MTTTNILILVVLAGLLVLTFVLPMLTNKKNQAKSLELKESIKEGDKVMTIGAIIGTVKNVVTKEDGSKEIVITTGEEGSQTTMTIDIQGIYKNFTAIEAQMAAQAEAMAKAQEAKTAPADAVTEPEVAEVVEEAKEETAE